MWVALWADELAHGHPLEHAPQVVHASTLAAQRSSDPGLVHLHFLRQDRGDALTPEKLQKAVDGMTSIVQNFKDRSRTLCQSTVKVFSQDARHRFQTWAAPDFDRAHVQHGREDPYIYTLFLFGGRETHEHMMHLRATSSRRNPPLVFGPTNLYSGLSASVAHLVGGPILLVGARSYRMAERLSCVCVFWGGAKHMNPQLRS